MRAALGLACLAPGACALGATAQPQPGLVFPGDEETHATLIGHLLHDGISELRPVGTTSVVLRARRGDVSLGAYRPAATTHPRGHAHEIAAYRIAEMLGLDNVPPTVGRVLPRSELERKLDPALGERRAALLGRIIFDAAGRAQGSMTHWVPVMRELGLDQPESVREWSAKLRQGSRLESSTYPRSLLRDLSNCLLFDYLIGNTDRFSGANLQGLPDRSRVFIRDHNLAFFAELTPVRRERLSTALQRSERFSRSTVERLVALSPESLDAGLARDGLHREGAPLLSAGQVSALFARRSTLLSYVGALIDQHGEEAVLVFE